MMFTPKLLCRSIVVFLFLVTDSAFARRLPKDSVSVSNGVRGARRQEQVTFRKLSHDMDNMCMGDETCAPSSVPSSVPSVPPSGIPSSTPSQTPSGIPSESPTESPAPSTSPSSDPSSKPSPTPSHFPSFTPSLSLEPTLSPSQAPSVTKTVDGTDNDGFALTSCVQQTPISATSSIETSRLEFVYHLSLLDVEVEKAEEMASSIEPRLHTALAKEAMTCDWGTPFVLVELWAADADTVDGRCPGVVADAGRSCWVVNGRMTANVFYHNRRRLMSSEALSAFTGWLTSALPGLKDDVEIFGLELQGFHEVDLPFRPSGDGNAAGDAGTTQLNMSNFPQDEATNSAWALAMIALAGTVLAVLVITMIVRRRSRRAAYLEHLAQVNDLDLEPEMKEEMEARGVLVNDMDLNSVGEAFQTIELEDANHDYRACASPSCELCQKRTQPVFVASDMDSVQAEVEEDLGPKRYKPGNRNHVDDTQVL